MSTQDSFFNRSGKIKIISSKELGETEKAKIFDTGMKRIGLLFNKQFAVNSTRIKKFLSNTLFISNSEIVNQFNRPYNIRKALEKTIKNEFTPK